jgi:putative membrane-bound dehydrogenase-like protein
MSARVLFIPFALAALGSLCSGADFPTPNNQPETIPLTKADQLVSMMHLPPGFKATVFAHEPDVQQPIAMCWDDRGRLWIAENYTYSDAKERFDLNLHDRILIFEDTDNDGHFDKRTVFADNLQMLTSIERGFGGVYALCPPNLLFIPTKDDKPSGPPQVLLDGFSTTAASRHTFANGLKWGPDGWLYGRIGISSTSWIDLPGTPQEKRKPTAGGTWRYHPTKKIYEPYCHGTTNPWGMDWNPHGDMFFINTVIGHFWQGIEGAHFKRMHGEDPYAHVYDLIDQHADHYHWDTGKKWSETRDSKGLTDTLGGGHAHVGMMIYEGTNFPKEYRGQVFMTNLHGHRVNVDHLVPEGSGYVAKHGTDFMKTDDPWFRAVEIQYGPDGGVYILDWSDIGECHEADGVHRTSGRIYKITYGDPVKPKETDLTKLKDEALVNLQLSDNEWLARMARWELRERAFQGDNLEMLGRVVVLQALLKEPRPEIRLRLLSTLAITGANMSVKALGADWTANDDIKGAVIKMLTQFSPSGPPAECQPLDQAVHAKLLELASNAKTSQPIRLKLASVLQRTPADQRVELAGALLAHAEDSGDHNLPLMYWYGIRDLAPSDLAKLVPHCRIPLDRQFIARRVTEDIEKDPAPLNALLGQAANGKAEALSADILKGMTEALKGWRKAKKPEGWEKFAANVTAGNNATLQTTLRDINVLFGDGRALNEVTKIALDNEADTEARRAALQTLIDAKSPDLRKVCETLLNVPSLGVTAAQGFASFDDPALAQKMVGRYKNFYPHERSAIIAALVARPTFAKVLLKAIADGKIERKDLSPVNARQIRSFNDDALTQQLAAVWGESHESSDDKKKIIAGLKAKLTPEVIAKGDQHQGRLIFSTVCAVCHRLYGEGNDIGPDLTGSGRHDINYLLENVVDPSAIVAADFKMSVITLTDGRVLNGIIHGQTDRTLTVKMIGQEVTVEKAEITKQEQLPVSMMPEGLLTALGDEQARNLIAYLMSNAQVTLPQASAQR